MRRWVIRWGVVALVLSGAVAVGPVLAASSVAGSGSSGSGGLFTSLTPVRLLDTPQRHRDYRRRVRWHGQPGRRQSRRCCRGRGFGRGFDRDGNPAERQRIRDRVGRLHHASGDVEPELRPGPDCAGPGRRPGLVRRQGRPIQRLDRHGAYAACSSTCTGAASAVEHHRGFESRRPLDRRRDVSRVGDPPGLSRRPRTRSVVGRDGAGTSRACCSFYCAVKVCVRVISDLHARGAGFFPRALCFS